MNQPPNTQCNLSVHTTEAKASTGCFKDIQVKLTGVTLGEFISNVRHPFLSPTCHSFSHTHTHIHYIEALASAVWKEIIATSLRMAATLVSGRR